MANQADFSDNPISFDILSFLWQKKFRIVFSAALIFSLGTYYVLKLPKIYTATSTLLLGYNENKFSFPQQGGSVSVVADNKMDTHIEFIRSRRFAEMIVRENALYDETGFRSVVPLPSVDDEVAYATGVLQSHMSLTKAGTTDMLRVSFDSTSPDVAAKVANLIGPAFFEFQIERGKEKALNASRWLNEQLEVIEGKVADSEQLLQDFFDQNQIVDIDSEMEILRVQISALKQEKIYSDRIMLELQASVDQIDAANGDVSQIVQVPWVLRNAQLIEAMRLIVNEEQLFTEVSKRYKFKHQKYIAAKARVDQLYNKRDKTLEKILVTLQKDYQTAVSRNAEILSQIEETEQKHRVLGLHETQLSKLRRQVEATQNLYEVFLSRLQETEILQDLGNQDEFSVVDSATVPKYPSKPKVLLMLFVLAFLAVIVSVGGWLFLHLISDKQTRVRQMLRKLGVPLLAEIPKINSSSGAKNIAKTLSQGELDHVYSEAIRSLRTSIVMRSDELNCKSFVFTGVQDGDGKTTMAISVAQAFAKLEKVILVDSDLRVPYIGPALGLKKARPGLTSFISRRVRFNDCVFRQPETGLNVLPSGPLPGDPMIHISTSRFSQLIQKLSQVYERVVLDSPSVNSVSDVLVISKSVDGVVLVCNAEKVDLDNLIEAIQRLKETGVPLLGVVLNKVKRVSSKRRRKVKLTQVVRDKRDVTSS